MDAEQLHFPDFDAPDLTQPTLQRVDLAQPGFSMPDPQRPDSLRVEQLPLWPDDLARPDEARPDPALPDLTEPDVPATLKQPDEREHVMPEPEYAPDVVMQQRPGEMDPDVAYVLLNSPDVEDLPAHITYTQLYTSQDEMSKRKRHLGMLELGLEKTEGDER